jgi:hypothetical protein
VITVPIGIFSVDVLYPPAPPPPPLPPCPPPPPATTKKSIETDPLPPVKPNPFAEAPPRVDNKGILSSPYLNCVIDANTTYVDAAVFNAVYEYTSVDEAFPAVGADPPCQIAVTVVPST